MFSNITNREIQLPGMLISRNIGQAGHLRCTYDWHNRRSGRKSILFIPPPIALDHLTVGSTTLRVSGVDRFKIEVCQKWEMCYKELDTSENIPVVQCSKGMWIIFNQSIIAKPKIEFREEHSQGICWLKWSDFEVFQSTPEMIIYHCFRVLAKRLNPLKVVCVPQWIPWIPLFVVLSILIVQFSCLAIRFPPRMFHSKYLPMSLCLCWIWGTGEIMLLRVYRFVVGSIFKVWRTWYVVIE